MAGAAVDKLIFDIGESMEDWLAFKEHPAALLARHRDVSPELARAVLEGDAKQLYDAGVNGYLLLRYCHWLGVDVRALMQLVSASAEAR